MAINSIIVLVTLLTTQQVLADSMDLRQAEPQPTRAELIEPAVVDTVNAYAKRPDHPAHDQGLKLNGPRIGMVYLMGDVPERLQKGGIPVLTQIGWQFENYFFRDESGWTGVSEYVLMVAGMERELLLPSASWLVGIRSPTGIEFGIGPTLSMATMAQGISDDEFGATNVSGLGAVVAAGMTFRAGRVNFPVNVALVKSGESNRFVLSCGFNLQDS